MTEPTSSPPELLGRLIAGRDLSTVQAEQLFSCLVSGEVGESLIAAILTALACKGESAHEIAGAAAVMRRNLVKIPTRRMTRTTAHSASAIAATTGSTTIAAQIPTVATD